MLSALFMYSLIHEGTNLYVPVCCWVVNEGISWVHGHRGETFFFFSLILSWNWILYQSSFHKETVTDACCTALGRTEEGLFCLLSSSLTDWMSPSLRHFSRKTKRTGNPAEPQARPSFNHHHSSHSLPHFLTADRNRWRVIRKKWRSGGVKERDGESQEIRVKVRKPTADSGSSDNSDIRESISSCTVSADALIWGCEQRKSQSTTAEFHFSPHMQQWRYNSTQLWCPCI